MKRIGLIMFLASLATGAFQTNGAHAVGFNAKTIGLTDPGRVCAERGPRWFPRDTPGGLCLSLSNTLCFDEIDHTKALS